VVRTGAWVRRLMGRVERTISRYIRDQHASGLKATTSEPKLAKVKEVGTVGMSKVAGMVADTKDLSVEQVDKVKAEKDGHEGFGG